MDINRKELYVEWKGKDGLYRLQPITENIVRCVYTKEEAVAPPSKLIDPEAFPKSLPFWGEGEAFPVHRYSRVTEIGLGTISVQVDQHSEHFTWRVGKTRKVFLAENGKELIPQKLMSYSTGGEEPRVELVKTVDGERFVIKNLKGKLERMAWKGRLHFSFKPDEVVYGFGQGEEGILNYRGESQFLYPHNMRSPFPFFVSSEHYGILFDCGCLMTFQDDTTGSYLMLDTVDQLDYYFITGDTVDEIIKGYRLLTGQASMLPKWAFGYLQSKERYKSGQELEDVVRRYRRDGVPIDGVIQDWKTWEEGHWGEKRVDKRRFGNLKENLQQIHDMHAHAMVSIWPKMERGTVDHMEMASAGCLLNDMTTYNAFDEQARKIYWRQLKAELYPAGFDAWWSDATEPYSDVDWTGAFKREPWERYLLVGGEHKKMLGAERANLYSLAHAKGIYENQRAETEDRRVFNLTRTGYAGIQKYGTAIWSGDTTATWDTLRKQIAEGLSVGLSGYPYWTMDIGGFFTVNEKTQNRGCDSASDRTPKWFWKGDYEDGVKDRGYQELYTRWLQVGCFLPLFRSHGTDTPREIWNFEPKDSMYYKAIVKFIKLRYRLMPYIYSLAGNVALHGGTMMRALVFDFPNDPKAIRQETEFMFGPAFLVCPVLQPMYFGAEDKPVYTPKSMTCYLPAGAEWVDFWSGRRFRGGQDVQVDVTMDMIPLFVRVGSIIPMAEGLTYADEDTGKPVEMVVYAGADGDFTYYNDEGDGYAYEKGRYQETPYHWDDAAGTLTPHTYDVVVKVVR